MSFPDKGNFLVQALTRGKRQMRQESESSFYMASCPLHAILVSTAGAGVVGSLELVAIADVVLQVPKPAFCNLFLCKVL